MLDWGQQETPALQLRSQLSTATHRGHVRYAIRLLNNIRDCRKRDARIYRSREHTRTNVEDKPRNTFGSLSAALKGVCVEARGLRHLNLQ
jgi:hypothetical protein